jgi:glycosyltransferase involved in cell wall biosynthesis
MRGYIRAVRQSFSLFPARQSGGAPGPGTVQVSVIIPALGEAENLAALLPELRDRLVSLGISHEILVVDHAPDAAVAAVADANGAVLLEEPRVGYGAALRCGFARAGGEYVLTMDADLSHPARFVERLWGARGDADVLIASRYVPGASYRMPILRAVLSRVLNLVFSRGLDLRVRDMSSGFRLYRARVLESLDLESADFAVLQEILVKAHCQGWGIREVPFEYRPRLHGASHARIIAFGVSYARTFRALRRIRNSRHCADYDGRDFDSGIPMQRLWQRRSCRKSSNGCSPREGG